MKISHILGLNARSRLYLTPYNKKRGRKIADSKLKTKKVLLKEGIPTPSSYATFKSPGDVYSFKWEALPDSFVVKPDQGFGGEGIIVVRKKAREKGYWITSKKELVNIEDLKIHILDILDGVYSLHNIPDRALIEEYVGKHKVFRKYAVRGTPDIRIIVFNKVPVLAMLRLPTRESGGKANLHQEAIGVGIDIATGITTWAIQRGGYIRFKPGTERKLNGIKIPNWTDCLTLAVRTQEVSGLGFLGCDIIMHPDKGPMVLELNARPGLQIQLANKVGLRKRLDRVEDLEVRDAEHGVKIAKALFAERFADRVAAEEGIKTIGVWEPIRIVSREGNKVEVLAKIDTGAWRTSMDRGIAEKLGLLHPSNILWSKKVRTSLGKEERQVINLKYYLAGRRIKTIASLASRSHLRVPVIVGRRDLEGFVVSPKHKARPLGWVPEMWAKRINDNFRE